MKRSLIVLSVLSLVCTGVAQAEVAAGDIQLDFLGAWTQQNISGGGHTQLFFAALRPGIALTDNIRVAAVGDYTHVGVAGTNVDIYALGVSGEYVFMPTNLLNPYVGGMITYANASKSFSGPGGGDGWVWAPRVGVLYTLNRTNNVFAEYQYQMFTGGLNDIVNNAHLIVLGIEHKFKTGR
jgi:hypothetical protein